MKKGKRNRRDKELKILLVDKDKTLLNSFGEVKSDGARFSEGESIFQVLWAEDTSKGTEILKAQKVDLLLSDPSLSAGLRILKNALIFSPSTLRIAYSSYGSISEVLKAAYLVHRFIPKSLEFGEAKKIIAKTLELKQLITSPQIADYAAEFSSLPTIPELHLKLLELLGKPDCSVAEVSQLVKEDPSLSAEFLKLVNSTFFGVKKPVFDPAMAVSLLGLKRARIVILGLRLFSLFPRRCHITVNEVKSHCVKVASVAQAVCRNLSGKDDLVEASYAAGLFHDIGKIVLAAFAEENYAKVKKETQGKSTCTVDLEKELCGASHNELGAYLVGLWGLPDELFEAVLFHHSPSLVEGEAEICVASVHIANYLVHHLEHPSLEEETHILDYDYLERSGLSEELSNLEVLGRTLLFSRTFQF